MMEEWGGAWKIIIIECVKETYIMGNKGRTYGMNFSSYATFSENVQPIEDSYKLIKVVHDHCRMKVGFTQIM